MEYIDFLKNKMAISHETGFEIKDEDLTHDLYPHVKDTVKWEHGAFRLKEMRAIQRKAVL